MNIIDAKITLLLSYGVGLPFVEWYSHENADCFKILNPYTEYREEKLVLCTVERGFTQAINIALLKAHEWRKKYEESLLT